jgi:hypothetical protein
MKLFRKFMIVPVIPVILFINSVAAQTLMGPVISKSVFVGRSKPLRETKVVLPGYHHEEQQESLNIFPYGTVITDQPSHPADTSILQKAQGTVRCRGPILNFEGIGNENGIFPADPNGEVGPNHYLQTVNSSFAFWDKGGNLLFGPADNKTLWETLPGPWNTYYWFDPVFKYDHMADRWVVMSPSTSYSLTGPFYTMVAVSVTPDPLGEYYCYAFEFEKFNDYAKLAIWPDGYYITYNMYDAVDPEAFAYSLVTVVDREAMLAGEAEITMIQYEIPEPDVERFFPMAADLRGPVIPDNEPCYILTIDNHNPDNPWELSLDVYSFHPDWQQPAHSDFGITAQFDLGNFESYVPYGPGAPQKGSDINLITMPLYLMYPVTFRQFEDHASLVCCHTVWDGVIHYIKWYEMRKETAGWSIYQTGNYAPGDFHYFTPSITINGNGDMALGYTVSNKNTYPCLRMTGRRSEDPPGIMTFQELELFKGLNYANNYLGWYNQNMWGDYAAMMVDPVDDSTFWFTHMYTKATTSSGNWATRIFSFNLSSEPEQPYTNAGNDTLTCNTPIFTTQGYAENYSSLVWTTSGDGNFITNNTPNAMYHRGSGDLSNGEVTLTIHLTGYEPGTEMADSMTLYINKEPEVFAGPNISIDSGEVVTLQGEVNFAYEYFWSTLGDGIFTDSTMLATIYTPGTQDVENGGVILVLTAGRVSPCTGNVTDSLTINIITVGIDEVSSKGFMMTLYPNPSVNTITLEADISHNDKLTVQVIDGAGKAIFTERLSAINHIIKKQFDFAYLNPGIYFIRVQGDDAAVTRKLVITQ